MIISRDTLHVTAQATVSCNASSKGSHVNSSHFSAAVSRQHPATKAGTLGLALILAGAALAGGDRAWAGRALTVLAILFVTLPVASHMLERAATRQQFSRDEIARAPLYPRP